MTPIVAKVATCRPSGHARYPWPRVSTGDPFGPVTPWRRAPDGRPRARQLVCQPRELRVQVTANRAPPPGAGPTVHRPLVARTMASAIARPRPAPDASPDVA